MNISRNKTLDRADWMAPEERVEFYLNNQAFLELDHLDFEEIKNQDEWNRREMHLVSYNDLKHSLTHWYCKYLVELPGIRGIRVLPFYKSYRHLHSIVNFFHPFDKLKMDDTFKEAKYPLFYGETGKTGTLPMIRKARRKDDYTSVLYNFKTLRLTRPSFQAIRNDVPWNRKMDRAIWRGATTGLEQRVDFVKKYFHSHDVAFSSVVQKPELAHLRKESVSIKDQLNYKFIVSLEGNDVASNLRWILASNSVPIMKRSYWQSWIMEDRLVPNFHYLELNEELDNLDELLSWALENDSACWEIAQNGKNYMAQFLDVENDLPIQKMLLEEFTKRITYLN